MTRHCEMCLSPRGYVHPDDKSPYCAQCESKVEDIRAEAKAEEREACAKQLETEGTGDPVLDAAAIRARGKTPKEETK